MELLLRQTIKKRLASTIWFAVWRARVQWSTRRRKERDRYTPWLHREVQGRVAGPVVQLRFISLFPGRVRVSSSELAHYGAADLA